MVDALSLSLAMALARRASPMRRMGSYIPLRSSSAEAVSKECIDMMDLIQAYDSLEEEDDIRPVLPELLNNSSLYDEFSKLPAPKASPRKIRFLEGSPKKIALEEKKDDISEGPLSEDSQSEHEEVGGNEVYKVGTGAPQLCILKSLGQELENESSIKFKEVRADSLRYLDPMRRAEAHGVRAALGNDYEAHLRQEAARGGQQSRVAKSRHQLSSLYQIAKTQELESLERNSSMGGSKVRTATKRKYGW